MAQRLTTGGQQGAILLALLLLAGQAALFVHQTDHLASSSYQNCVTCVSLHVDDVLAARPALLTESTRRQETPDTLIALPAHVLRKAGIRIRSPPRNV